MAELRDKIASISIVSTTSVMYFSLVFLYRTFPDASQNMEIFGLVISALTSFGFYKFIAKFTLTLFNKSQSLRKLILGKAFLEGTWVGHWTDQGKNVFTVETIDQENGETVIIGRQIGDDLKTQADWSSESVFVDLRRERVIYVYSSDAYRTNHQHNGIGVFKMIRPKKNEAPNVLDGYSVDMTDGDKDVNREHKISDKIVGTEKAIEEARKIFKV